MHDDVGMLALVAVPAFALTLAVFAFVWSYFFE
jgi:hypothetical protein